MRFSRTLLIPVLFTLTASQAALAQEAVYFSLTESELSTPTAREALLDRMAAFSTNSCRGSSVLTTRAAVRRCANDLKEQFIAEIDDEKLTQLAESRSKGTYRSARR